MRALECKKSHQAMAPWDGHDAAVPRLLPARDGVCREANSELEVEPVEGLLQLVPCPDGRRE